MQKLKAFQEKPARYAAAIVAAGALLCLTPAAVFAEDSLDMSTDYPGITVTAGDTVSFSLDFYVEEACDVSLSVDSIPDEWEGYFEGDGNQISVVHVPASSGSVISDDTSDLVTFTLSVPEDAAEDTYTVKLAADGGTEGTDSLPLTVDVTTEATGVSSFEAEYPEQQGATGTTFTFDTTLTNSRGTGQNFALTSESEDGWTVTYSYDDTSVTSVSLDANTSGTVTISVSTPETVSQGTYEIPITATGPSDTLSLTLTVDIIGTYDVSLSTPSGNLSLDAYASTDESFTLTVTNNGNVDLDNLSLSSDLPSDWEISFSEDTIETLAAGGVQGNHSHPHAGL
ncbi:MAG: NEW3 domain-containing protein [Clostridiales bacterium]|nr:NEW3 domain-containing protein [Clostridiales bacterium]